MGQGGIYAGSGCEPELQGWQPLLLFYWLSQYGDAYREDGVIPPLSVYRKLPLRLSYGIT